MNDLIKFFADGHPNISYNGSEIDDIDNLPALIEQSDCLDSNGSEVLDYWLDAKNQVHVLFAVYEREFSNGIKYDEQMYKLIGTIDIDDAGNGPYHYLKITQASKIVDTVDEVIEQINHPDV